MIRFLLSRLASEKVIDYLANTYVVRRAAQMTVSAYYRISGDKRLHNAIKSERAQRIITSFKENMKKELEDAQRQIKKGPK